VANHRSNPKKKIKTHKNEIPQLPQKKMRPHKNEIPQLFPKFLKIVT